MGLSLLGDGTMSIWQLWLMLRGDSISRSIFALLAVGFACQPAIIAETVLPSDSHRTNDTLAAADARGRSVSLHT